MNFLYCMIKITVICHSFYSTFGQEELPPSYECNSTVSSERGFLFSPNYPRNYNRNDLCTWHITVAEDRSILLSFSSFDIESNLKCRFEYVAVYNGLSKTHRQLGKFCGGFNPADVRSTSNHMLVVFKADGDRQRKGFLATFESIRPHNAGPNSCGGLMTSNSGSFHSVNFPNSNYENGQTCTWIIRVTNDREIVLRFAKLTLEDSSNCYYDHVTIFSGWSDRSETTTHGKFCKISAVPNAIISNGNRMFITFASDSSGNDVGFSASYTTRIRATSTNTEVETAETGNNQKPKAPMSPRQRVCPETVVLHSESGVIISPGYKSPSGYPPNLRCSWKIETSPGTRIALRFTNFQLEEDSECIFDYVQVYSGRNEFGNEIGRYCGSMEDVTLHSSGNLIFLLFVTDSGRNEAGFRALYFTDSNSVEGPTTSLSSPRPFTTTAYVTVPCQQSCLSRPSVSDSACSSSFVASIKVLRFQNLTSGVLRLKGVLIKFLKLTLSGIPRRRKTRFEINLTCPACYSAIEVRQKYIFAGSSAEETRIEINAEDYFERYSKRIQKSWRRSIRKCNRRN